MQIFQIAFLAYTHSIPWVLIGKIGAKKNKGFTKLYYNKIDNATQWLNYGETHGILIGPHSSNLISEIILVAVDYKLSKKYKYIR
ncbi:RNA-directed DNA polymerase, partial [Campylobacter coli]|nr:RNA-directed DNA polymerase [Campylobacter coli]